MVTPDDPFAGLPLPERIAARAADIAAKASSLAADAEPVQGAHVTTGSLPPDSDPDRHRTAWLLPDGTCALPEPDTIAWVTVSDTPDGPARRVPVSEAGAYPPQSGLPTDAAYVDPAREAGRLRALLAEADQRAALLRRQVEYLTAERDEAATDADRLRVALDSTRNERNASRANAEVSRVEAHEARREAHKLTASRDKFRADVTTLGLLAEEMANDNERLTAVLAEILDERRWQPREVVVQHLRRDGAVLEATRTELADWRARMDGQPTPTPEDNR